MYSLVNVIRRDDVIWSIILEYKGFSEYPPGFRVLKMGTVLRPLANVRRSHSPSATWKVFMLSRLSFPKLENFVMAAKNFAFTVVDFKYPDWGTNNIVIEVGVGTLGAGIYRNVLGSWETNGGGCWTLADTISRSLAISAKENHISASWTSETSENKVSRTAPRFCTRGATWGVHAASASRKSLFGFLREGIAELLDLVTRPKKIGWGVPMTFLNGGRRRSDSGGGESTPGTSNSSSDSWMLMIADFWKLRKGNSEFWNRRQSFNNYKQSLPCKTIEQLSPSSVRNEGGEEAAV